MSVRKQILFGEHRNLLPNLKALDLGPIAAQLMYPQAGGGWTYEQTTNALVRYLMFLSLVYLYPNHEIVPTTDIDLVWHTHILDTYKYASDCQMLFGRFVHHFPYFGLRGEVDQQNWNTAFAQTQALFEEHFGADALGTANLPQAACEPLKAGQSQKAGACEPLNVPKQNRPRVDIEADVLKAFLSA